MRARWLGGSLVAVLGAAPEMAAAQIPPGAAPGVPSASTDDGGTPAAQAPSAEGAAVRTGLPGQFVYGGQFDSKAAVDIIKQSRGKPGYVSAFADAEMSGYVNYDTWL